MCTNDIAVMHLKAYRKTERLSNVIAYDFWVHDESTLYIIVEQLPVLLKCSRWARKGVSENKTADVFDFFCETEFNSTIVINLRTKQLFL